MVLSPGRSEINALLKADGALPGQGICDRQIGRILPEKCPFARDDLSAYDVKPSDHVPSTRGKELTSRQPKSPGPPVYSVF